MKQNSAGRGAGDLELDPAELWCQLGLLVTESRQPHASFKGWKEGPHCVTKQSKHLHSCAPSSNPLCKKKDAITREIRSLGKNNIPICIEVILLPDCYKHDHRLDLTKGQYLLLEQWKFQLLPKRNSEYSVEIASLFQAVKSYLHFSQLSAWLNQTHGTAPKFVEYRVSPPAEFCTNTFQEAPSLHRFPLCSQQHYTIQVSVAALPRQTRLLQLPCPDIAPLPSIPLTTRRRISSPVIEGAAASRSSPCSSLSPRSGSPSLGLCCGVSVAYADAKWREEGGGDGVTVGPFHDARDLTRSKTFKDFHSDDSSDSSEPSVLTLQSQQQPSAHKGSNNSALKTFPSSPSMQSFIETSSSPRFYLPVKPAIDRISNLSSSSDSSHNGVREKDSSLGMHRPSPPIDYTPSRDMLLSSTRKLATKLSFEPLPAFELEAQVCKSVQIDLLPSASSARRQHLNATPRDYSYTACAAKSLETKHDQLAHSQKETSLLHNDVTDQSRTHIANRGSDYSAAAAAAAVCTSSHSPAVANGNTNSHQSFSNGVNPCHLPSNNTVSNSCQTVHNGSRASNGFYATDNDSARTLFDEPKTPEKPLKSILSRHLQNTQLLQGAVTKNYVPSVEERNCFRKALCRSSATVFTNSPGLPLQSSPAPIKRLGRNSFDFDDNLTCSKAIKNSLSCVNLEELKPKGENESGKCRKQRMYSTSAPASTNSLLGNFEESLLNGRIEPCGAVEGFVVDIGASGSFCPKHITLPVTAFFFKLSEDNAPSPYLGHVSLEGAGKRGYHVPSKGTIQVTLFNPNKTVVKMFVLTYDLCDMPANCTTFLRQRTLYKPVSGSCSDTDEAPQYLRYLIHLRVASTKSRKLYLHSDIRMIFARDKFEYDSRIANYEYRSLTEGPVNPKYSPKK